MRYRIVLGPEARSALERIRAYDRIAILEAIDTHLRYEPTHTSKSRIKTLRQLAHPQYRLRIGDLRLFYDVTEDRVEIVAIMQKDEVETWLARWATLQKEEP